MCMKLVTNAFVKVDEKQRMEKIDKIDIKS